MGINSFNSHFLDGAKKYIGSIPIVDQASIAANITSMQLGGLQSVQTKQLKGQVRELIVGHHRIIYFQLSKALYFVRGFRKKSKKTPKSEIEYAEKIYKMMKSVK